MLEFTDQRRDIGVAIAWLGCETAEKYPLEQLRDLQIRAVGEQPFLGLLGQPAEPTLVPLPLGH